MAGLGDTITSLLGQRRQAAHEPPGHGVFTEIKAFGANPGGLRMFAYRPARLRRGAATVVVLHGCGQNRVYADAVGWLQLAERLGFAVLVPQQRGANNPGRCFNWFQLNDVRRGSGEAASIAHMVETLLAQSGGDPGRVFVTGLSAGGAMAAAMLAAYPEKFAGGAILSGIAYRGAEGFADGFRAMGQGPRPRPSEDWAALVRSASPHGGPWPRLSIWQGGADRVVHPANAEALARQWAALHELPEAPSRVEPLAGRRRSVWANGGPPLVELHLIDGLGHGAPIAGAGPDALGRVQDFVLESGISSTLEIARFWGLDTAPASRGR